jgi:hypothetical protein
VADDTKKPRKNPRKRAPYVPTGRGKGRRTDIPWVAIEDLYVHGEMIPTPAGTTERVWPSAEDIAARFLVDRTTIHNHCRKQGWVALREQFRRSLFDKAAERAKNFVGQASELWGEQAQKAWDISATTLDEARYALEYHRSGAASIAAASAKRSRNRPGGGDAEAQGGEGDDVPMQQVLKREPMPMRDLKDHATAVKTTLETMRGLLFGQQPTATSPTSAATTSAPSPVTDDPRVRAVTESFLRAAAAANKAPAPSEK